MKKYLITLVIMTALLLPVLAAGQQMNVTVSIMPQKYFAERIGGSHVNVTVMVPPGVSYHTYEPKPKQMVELSKSKIYFTIGDIFEETLVERLSKINRNIRIVPTDEGVEKIPMVSDITPLFDAHHDHAHDHTHDHEHEHEHEHAHAHDHGHDHHHGEFDQHIWLSPKLAPVFAETMMNAMSEADPDHAEDYRANYKALVADIQKLDSEIGAIFDSVSGGREFIVFHPAWGYFADAYGLTQVPVEIEGKEPKPADLIALIEFARERGIKVVFVQPQISQKSAEMIAREIEGETVTADPLAGDWLENLREVAAKFKSALK